MMEYLLKASAVIAIFYTCYKIFLQRDTFFESNRWFLVIGLLIAFLIPFLVIPIYIEYTPITLQGFPINEQISTENIEKPYNILDYLPIIYGLGVIFFSIRFVVQLISLGSVIFKNKRDKQGKYTFVKSSNAVSPFSFFNWIVYNPDAFTETELEQIIIHEKVHVCQHHTIDVLLAQLSCIVFWFNPVIWLYNKDLKQNLEFIADEKAANNSTCKKSYQYTLLKTSMPTHQLALTNNFYTSLIKKRIVMLHKSKSKKINLFKYILIIPLLALFLMSFNTKEVIFEKEMVSAKSLSNNDTFPVSEKTKVKNPISTNLTTTISNINIEVIITKDFTESDFENLKTKFKTEGFTLKIKGVKRNDKGEIISIKIDVSSKIANANYNIDTDDTISPIIISIDDDGKNISIGNGNLKKERQMVFVSKDGKKHVLNHAGSENNVFVVSSDDDKDDSIEIEKYIVKGDDSIHVIKKQMDKMIDIDSDKNILFIGKDDNGKKIHKRIKIETDDNDSNIEWTTDNNDDKVIITGKSDAVVKIKPTDGKEPLIIADGKEITAKEMKDIDPENIKNVDVLKGESATKKYGDKGKNGVVIITLKEK